jgi:spermidine/putrescine transport system permease protein
MKPRDIAVTVYLTAAIVFIFLPVAILVQYSFQDGLVPVPPFRGFSLRWWETMLGNRRLMEALGNSVVVGATSSFAAVAIGFLAAYGLARARPRHAGRLQFALMAPLTVPYIIIALGLLNSFGAIGIDRSLVTVGIGHAVINLPLCFAIVYSQLGAHQANIERAAHDLGASDLQALLLVTVPMLWPALLAAFFIAFTLSWDEFVIAFLLSRFDVTLPVVIWNMLNARLDPTLNAVGTLVFATSVGLVIVVALLLFRWGRRHG